VEEAVSACEHTHTNANGCLDCYAPYCWVCQRPHESPSSERANTGWAVQVVGPCVASLRADVARLTAELAAVDRVAEERRDRAKRAEAEVERLRAVAEAAERVVATHHREGDAVMYERHELRAALAAWRGR
jgi:hypothetical protein